MLAAYRNGGHFTVIVDGYRLDFKYPRTYLDEESLKRNITVHVKCQDVKIAPLEENIVAKVLILSSIKDLEDALKLMIMHYYSIDWKRVEELAGGDLKVKISKLLDRIEHEFSTEEAVKAKINELRKLLSKLK